MLLRALDSHFKEHCLATINQKMNQWLKKDLKQVFFFLGSYQKYYYFKNYTWLYGLLLSSKNTEYTFSINFWLLEHLKESFSNKEWVNPDEKISGF